MGLGKAGEAAPLQSPEGHDTRAVVQEGSGGHGGHSGAARGCCLHLGSQDWAVLAAGKWVQLPCCPRTHGTLTGRGPDLVQVAVSACVPGSVSPCCSPEANP